MRSCNHRRPTQGSVKARITVAVELDVVKWVRPLKRMRTTHRKQGGRLRVQEGARWRTLCTSSSSPLEGLLLIVALPPRRTLCFLAAGPGRRGAMCSRAHAQRQPVSTWGPSPRVWTSLNLISRRDPRTEPRKRCPRNQERCPEASIAVAPACEYSRRAHCRVMSVESILFYTLKCMARSRGPLKNGLTSRPH